MKSDILTATKTYNTKIKMFQYVTRNGEVLLTSKTEKGLDSNWSKFIKVWN